MNHYETLGLTEDATLEEIKKAYRKLAMKHHPDRNSGTQDSEEEFKKINEAYSVLSDSSKKKDYDMKQASEKAFAGFSSHGGNGSFHGDDMNDFMNQFFNQRGSPFSDIFGQHFATRQRSFRITLSFWEAIFGVTKKFEIQGSDGQKYPVELPFPPAIEEGTQIQIQLGESDTIVISVHIGADDDFQRDHLDLYTNIEIPLSTALLGGKIVFPHWEKNFEVKIPPGIQSGQALRINNAGVQKDIFRGDLYLVCKISMPAKLTKKQKELMEEFAKTEKKKPDQFAHLKQKWQNAKEQ